MSFRDRLDPRLHIAAAIGWAVFGAVTLAALITAYLVASQAEDVARQATEGVLAEFATQVRDAVTMNVETRRALLETAASQLSAAADPSPADMQRRVRALQAAFPEFAWLGVVNPSGRLLARTDTLLADTYVSAAPWFQQGRLHPYVSDAHVPLPLFATPAVAPGGWSQQLIDLAAPMPGGGSMVGFLSRHWLEQRVSHMQQALNQTRQVELMLASSQGIVLIGPPAWIGRHLDQGNDLGEAGQFVIGRRAQLRLADSLGLGWTAIVRQRADTALAPARSAGRTVFAVIFVAGLLSAVAAAAVTRPLTRRLTRLAHAAEAVRRGERRSMDVPAGADEVSRIGATLAQLVDQLQTDKQALHTLNTELDRRVLERTLRIRALADEAHQAAVTRERLRLARDLHDTLAHSLMALLTQIRLVRKLHTRMDASELDAELERAEAVAATGLADSRAAITQMRDNGVRDTGLGPALQDLAHRFGERNGMALVLQVDPDWTAASDLRAQTIFRIIEEALRNVERHAGAQTAGVRLEGGPGSEEGKRLRVEISDDGIGFDTELPRPGHYGLRGIHEQALLIGASLGVHSSPGQGTRIVLLLDD